jgi:multisubunit Na+/H+ antiporter MnhB subunit
MVAIVRCSHTIISVRAQFGILTLRVFNKMASEIKTETTQVTPGGALTVMALLVPSVILRGFVFSYLWQWFVVPLGAHSISISLAVGLALIVSYLTHQDQSGLARVKQDNPVGRAIGKMMFTPLFIWFIGWVIQLFV